MAATVDTKLHVPTPSTGPSMSPNTVPSEMFNASLDKSDLSQQLPEEEWGDIEGSPTHVADYAKEASIGTPQVTGAVRDSLAALQSDSWTRAVLASSCGWTPDLCRTTALPLLCHTRNTYEVVLLDLLEDDTVMDTCAVVGANPTISSLVLINSRGGAELSLQALGAICSLLCTNKHLESLSIMNCLHSVATSAMQMLGEALLYSRSLLRLNLECNSIQDSDFLPLAQALAGQRTLLDVSLDNNSLHYQGLGMMSEVMSFNERIQAVSLHGNMLRCPTDLWEGYFIQEQCQVNRELAILGPYTAAMHHKWPALWQRKMRKLWYVCKCLNVDERMWEAVLQFLDARGYVEQKVKLWMKLSPAPKPAASIWRHT